MIIKIDANTYQYKNRRYTARGIVSVIKRLRGTTAIFRDFSEVYVQVKTSQDSGRTVKTS